VVSIVDLRDHVPVGDAGGDPEQDHEEGATGRRWGLSLALILLGVAVLGFGLLERYPYATGAGLVIILFFGAVAAGAKRTSVGTNAVQADAEFKAPPPPPSAPRQAYTPKKRRFRR
jgi:hypothetical protein